jgi:hypothetical protein
MRVEAVENRPRDLHRGQRIVDIDTPLAILLSVGHLASRLPDCGRPGHPAAPELARASQDYSQGPP